MLTSQDKVKFCKVKGYLLVIIVELFKYQDFNSSLQIMIHL